MALQIAERAVVGEHVEPIARALEGAARLVPPVRAVADVRAQHGGPIVGGQTPGDREELVVGQGRDGVERAPPRP